MGESKRTNQTKVAAVIERLNNRTQQLYLAVGELAVYRVMAGAMDPKLYATVMQKLEGVEFTDVEHFFNAVTKAAQDRMLELDIAAEAQAKASIEAETTSDHHVTTPGGTPLIVPGTQNQVDQLIAGLRSVGMSTPPAED